jgi:radical SAM protein with 4Fe4S-binding SPASM domain
MQPAIMEFNTAKEIIDNAGFPRSVKMLSLYNVGEPLLNNALPNIIRYAKTIGFAQRASIVTNASLLTRDWSERLIHSGIDRIIISLYGMSDEDYLANTGKHVKFAEIRRNIRYLNNIKDDCNVFVKVTDRAVPTSEKQQEFLDTFKDHCSGYSIEPILPIWPNFKPEGDDPALRDIGLYHGVPAVDRLACHYPFYSMVVNARGFVNPCLADWDETLTLGNANEQSLSEIWNSKEYQDFRLVQLSGRRPGHFLCATCGTLRAATCPEDDIDGARLMLLEKMFPEIYKSHEENP